MTETKRVLVIGSGGREHSICIHLSNSTKVDKIFVLPGNAGTNTEKKCQNLSIKNHSLDDIVNWCCNNAIDLVVVGPEEPLILGLSDKLNDRGIKSFGPSMHCAKLEGSKLFGKQVMKACNIATAEYASFSDAQEALKYLHSSNEKMRVIKLDGLAAGKGVNVAKTLKEAESAVMDMLNKENPKFGINNPTILIEEVLVGPEISILALTDGKSVSLFPPCQDHKRIFEDDKGPNTGGMGAYCPYDFVDGSTLQLIKDEIIKIIDYMRENGHPYQGILYVGLILTTNGPFVLEFNCRFGDPETQVLLPHLKSDLFDVMMSCTTLGALEKLNVEFHRDLYTLCIVLVSGGYPDSYKKGYSISGLDKSHNDVHIVHAGTQFDETTGQIVTSGGRVLGVVASAKQLTFSYNLAMAALSDINFQDCFYRKDIGHRVLKKNYKKTYTYSGAGVNIEAGDELVEKIKSISSRTKRSGNISEIGSFGALFDVKQCGFKDPLLVSGTDGVGTKLKIATALNKHDTIGQDLVAMCVNDILCHGAEPLFFLDYFATGKLDVKLSRNVIMGIGKACQESGCSLIGGETAEMPGIYSDSDYDLAGFAVGAVERANLLPKLDKISHGDKIIGLLSSGLHSNGFSLVRKIISSYSLNDVFPFGDGKETLGNILLSPTALYVKPILQLLRDSELKDHVYSIAHITGGGIPENLPRSLPDNLKAIIDVKSWSIPPIFKWLWKLSSRDQVDFSKTFNLGIGLALVVSADKCSKIREYLEKDCHVETKLIGEVTSCKYRTENRVILENLEQSLSESCEYPLTELKLKAKTRVAVLISGSGTNLEALLKYSREVHECSYEIVLVISNVENVRGLDVAKMYGVQTKVIPHKSFSNRAQFDEAIDRVLSCDTYNCQLICLAGFMRILGKEFTEKWFGKIINIHPSLLPSFRGGRAHRDVLKSGVRLTGATVHFVIENVDAGGIITQEATKVFLDDTEESLSERIKTEIEHKLYPEALNYVAKGDCFLDSENNVQWTCRRNANL